MKKIAAFLSLVTVSTLPLHALDVVFAEHKSSDAFKRISEYLGGGENYGRYAVARTDKARREGFYIALKIDKSDAANRFAKVRVSYVMPGNLEPLSTEIEFQGEMKNRLLIGLTETDWAAAEARPLAWKIEVLDTQGSVVSEAKSFLWSPR